VVKRPLSLTIAVVLQWIAAVGAVFGGLDLIFAAFEMRQEGVALQLEGALVNQGIIDVSGTAIVTGVLLAGVLLLVIAFIRVMVAVYLARGQNWARIVVALVVLLQIAGGLAALFAGDWLRATGVIAVEVLVLWLLFNARSSAFIAERSASSS
jgi:hypothetical protein